MQLPLFPELNYAMHLTAASLVELFPNFQLLDLTVYPDRFSVDFSFARELSKQELSLVKGRFLEKVQSSVRGDVREMVSKNACDLLKHFKQIFLTELVDREEQFAEMLCFDTYNAPLFGEIDQDLGKIKDLQLDMYDLGEKKWMKRKVHHYRLDCFVYYSKADRKKREALLEEKKVKDHRDIGKEEKLFWVEDGETYFSGEGERRYQSFVEIAEKVFGEKVFFEGDESLYSDVSGASNFFVSKQVDGNYDGICYGLKETSSLRALMVFSFDDRDLKTLFEKFVKEVSLEGSFDENNKYVLFDYLGTPWVCGEIFHNNNSLILEINLQCIFALALEKSAE